MEPLPKTRDEYIARWSDTDYWLPLAERAFSEARIDHPELVRQMRGTNIVFKTGGCYLKIYSPIFSNDYFSEVAVLPVTCGLPVPVPELLHHGALGDGWYYSFITEVKGVLVDEVWSSFSREETFCFMESLGRVAQAVHALPVPTFSHFTNTWADFIEKQMHGAVARHTLKELPEHLIRAIPDFLACHVASVCVAPKTVLLMGEYTPDNLLVMRLDGRWKLSALIDFGDAMSGHPLYDLLWPTMFYGAGDVELQRAFLTAYDPALVMTEELRSQLMTLALLHRYSHFDQQIGIDDWRSARNFDELAMRVWPLAA